MASSKQIAAQLVAYDKGRKSSADILNDAMTKYNVPEIRQNVAGLRTTLENTQQALNNVDPSVTGRTSRSLVTEAQRQAMVNNERAPIAQSLSSQQGELNTESANLADEQNAANTLAQGQINDDNTGRESLEQEYKDAVAREAAALQKAQSDRNFKLEQQKEAASEKAAAQSSSTPAHSQQRSDGGFNFQNSSGKAISARTYAALMGISFNSLIHQMASAGDVGAKDYLKNGNHSKYASALVWG